MFWKHLMGVISLSPMLFFSSQMLFIFLILMSAVLALSSTSSVFMWVMLEVNMMSFLPLITSEDRVFSSDSALKYFVSQSAASVVFLASYLFINSHWSSSILVFVSMLFKMGLAPFQGWLMSVFFSADLMSMFLIGTVQKIIPLHILSNSAFSPNWVLMLVVMNIWLLALLAAGAVGARLTLFLSSVANGLWLLTSMFCAASWLKFLMVYALVSGAVIVLLSHSFSLKTSHLALFSPISKSLLSMGFLSLGGLPPFLGFLPKLIILKGLSAAGLTGLMILMIFPSLIILWAYLAFTLSLYAMGEGCLVQETSPPLMSLIVGGLMLFSSVSVLF